MELLNYYNDIPIGKDHAVTKEKLSIRWHMDERSVRKIIQELRIADFGDNYVIISSSSGRGYYRSSDKAEIERFRKEIINRARNTFLPLKKINRVLDSESDFEGWDFAEQLDLFEMAN